MADRVRAAMQPSLAVQRASVATQARSVHQAAPSSMVPIVMPAHMAFDCEPVSEPQLGSMIEHAAERHGVDPAVVREVARQESAFHPCAVSPKGAEGLMQLMPATQAMFAVSDPFNAQESLEAGVKLLKQLIDRYHGDLTLALSAYNAGAGRVDKAGGIPDIPETRNYINEILTRLPIP